jgi:hypothetical protein
MDRKQLDEFVCNRNLDNFRRLACAAKTGATRETLLGLLAEEEDKYFELQKAGIVSPGGAR